MTGQWTTVDGNDACANVAYRLSDVIAIYPISSLRATPTSPPVRAATDPTGFGW